MAITNEDLEKMTASDKDAYIRLRQALDSLTNVALTEFDLSNPDFDFSETEFDLKDPKFDLRENEDLRREIFDTLSEATRQKISDIVSDGIKQILADIEIEHGKFWIAVSPARAASFAMHSRILGGAEEFEKIVNKLLGDKAEELLEAESLRGNDGNACPPGFMLVDGICVPI